MDDEKTNKPNISVNVNLDTTPIYYTDNIFMTTNEDGVMVDVCQKLGKTSQMRIVARFGMSRSHAKKFLREMSKLLAMTEGGSETGKKAN